MRAVVQRVQEAQVEVDGEVIAEGLGELEADWPADAGAVMVRVEDGSSL